MSMRQPKRPQTAKPTTMRIPQDVMAAADERAREQGLTRTLYVVTLIEKDVRRRRARKDDTNLSENETDTNIFG